MNFRVQRGVPRSYTKSHFPSKAATRPRCSESWAIPKAPQPSGPLQCLHPFHAYAFFTCAVFLYTYSASGLPRRGYKYLKPHGGVQVYEFLASKGGCHKAMRNCISQARLKQDFVALRAGRSQQVCSLPALFNASTLSMLTPPFHVLCFSLLTAPWLPKGGL